VPQAVSLWPPERGLLRITHSRERSQGKTERRIQCNFEMTTWLPIAA